VHRIGTELMRALVTQHSTFATFLSEPLDGLQRWQMFMILITVVCSQARAQRHPRRRPAAASCRRRLLAPAHTGARTNDAS
jgi:hypothetical protein